MTQFGHKVRALRRGANKTQSQVAKALGVSVAHVSAVERGAKNPFNSEQITKFLDLIGRREGEGWLSNLAIMNRYKIRIPTRNLSPTVLRILFRLARRAEVEKVPYEVLREILYEETT